MCVCISLIVNYLNINNSSNYLNTIYSINIYTYIYNSWRKFKSLTCQEAKALLLYTEEAQTRSQAQVLTLKSKSVKRKITVESPTVGASSYLVKID